MKVLVACEESQRVMMAFRKLGHEAYSNDIQDCTGGYPEFHLKMDTAFALNYCKWDLLIGFPSCQFMSKAGARWMYPTAGNIDKERLRKGLQAKAFFMALWNCNIPKISLENPMPLKVIGLPEPTQIIQPYEYGHPFSKKTLLWLKGLPELKPTEIITEYEPFMPSNTGGAKRNQKATFRNISKIDSSKTFSGIAEAMAQQWGNPGLIQSELKL